MEIAGALNLRPELSVDGSILSNGCVKEREDVGSDSASYEKSLLDEMDSYWEDLSGRLTVSRMVSDSLIRGMVNAIQEEANEKIALKDAEVAALTERLQYYESSTDSSAGLDLTLEFPKQRMEMVRCSIDTRRELDKLKMVAEEQPQRLPGTALEESLSEQRWREGIQREICNVIVQSHIRSLLDEFETKTREQRNTMNIMIKNWRKRVDEISTMRQELDAISRSLYNSDSGVLTSHRSIENVEEGNSGKRKDNGPWKVVGSQLSSALCSKELGTGNSLMEKAEELGKPIPNDSPQLKCMSKEKLVDYFRTEMNKMKRQHELALQEKTEELFSLKRGLLKEKGYSPLHISKEKNFELMKKKISELILKLDEVLLENKELPAVFDDQHISHGLKERIDTFLENRWLQGLLAQERMETSSILPQASTEPNSIEEIERLQLAIEEVKMEATIKEEKYKSVLQDLFDELERDEECLETVIKIVEDNYCTIYGGVMSDAFSSITPAIGRFNEHEELINAELLQTKKALFVETERNGRLKQEIESLSTLVKEKEKFALKVGSELVEQKDQLKSVCCELYSYRDQASKQEAIIVNTKSELDLLKGKLDDSVNQIHQKGVEISNLDQKLMIRSYSLAEMERENDILHNNNQELREKLASAITKDQDQKQQLAKMERENDILHNNNQELQEKLVSTIAKDQDQKQQLESIVGSMTGLSKTITASGCMLTQKIKAYESRLKELSHQFTQIKQQGILLLRKVSWYKDRFEARCEDLQKAENEVDLLGDEVDTLVGLLEKIYIALDHYSPVLQHYPGVVEILKLIRRETDEKITRSI